MRTEELSQASSVRARANGTFDADVSAEWTVAGKPNGGYLLALLGRAASSLTGAGNVVAASAHYLRSPDPGPVEIEGAVLRRGRSISQVRALMNQGGRPCVEALISTGELSPSATPRWDAGAPDVPHVPFDDCIRLPPVTLDGVEIPMYGQVDLRVDQEVFMVLCGRPTGRGLMRAWLGLLGEKGFDPISLLYAADALPPTTFDIDPPSWASTVELTAYVRAIPAPGPILIESRARLLDSHWIDETRDVWDGTGRLIAQAAQLARVQVR